MGQTKFIRFECDNCTDKQTIDVTSVVVSDPPPALNGWIFVNVSNVVGESPGVRIYCPSCCPKILKPLGFESYKDFISMVKANAEVERAERSVQIKEMTGIDIDQLTGETKEESN